MRIEIKTGGKPVKDKDLKAVYLINAALKMSSDRMRQANLDFAIGSFNAKHNPK